jgi:hypothetical protein
LKCLSEVIVVIHPANTGRDINNKKEVKNILQGNKGIYKLEITQLIERQFQLVFYKLYLYKKGLQ